MPRPKPSRRKQPKPAVRQKQPKPWTVAIYMVADGIQGNSNLDESANEARDQIKEALIAAGVGDDVDVAIQMDFKETNGTRRIILNRRKAIRVRREVNAGDPEVLQGFLRWVHEECPAHRYVVHFWGHSSGPVGLFFDRADDDARPDGLTLAELGYAFQHAAPILGQPVDLVLLKDCWLSTLEAATELRGGARFMVASQSEVPIAGWPYKEIFECLTAADTRSVAANVVDVLGDFYGLASNRGRFLEIPYSGVDLEAARGVDQPLRALATRLDTMRDGPHGPASRLALRRASRADPALIDVVAMCRHLERIDDAELQQQSEALSQAALASLVGRHPEPSIFQGLSLLYFPFGADPDEQSKNSRIAPAFFRPDLDVVDDYRTLELSENTRWERIALENFTPPPPPDNSEGAPVMPDDQQKGDSFAIDWSSKGDTLRITIKKKKAKKDRKNKKSKK
jgi:cysteine peptidase C11 family protein